MNRPRLPGANPVTRKRADGSIEIQWYAWQGKGAPLIGSFKGATTEAALAAERLGVAALATAYGEARRGPGPIADLASLCTAYETSADFKRIGASTQAEWARVLEALRKDEIVGDLSLRALQAKGARQLILSWRDTMAATPRKADYFMQVLQRVLNWAVDREHLTKNVIAGAAGLYASDRADVTWSDDEYEKVLAHLTPDAARVIRFMRLTGFRRGDAIRVTWSAINREKGSIIWRTSKSRKKRVAQVAELTPDLEALLAECEQRSTTILTTSAGRPWHKDGIGASFRRARIAAGIATDEDGRAKRMHDIRGTTATQKIADALNDADFKKQMGWAKGETKIAAKYVAPENVVALRKGKRNKP